MPGSVKGPDSAVKAFGAPQAQQLTGLRLLRAAGCRWGRPDQPWLVLGEGWAPGGRGASANDLHESPFEEVLPGFS